jgi:hypothetical protein
MVEYNKDTEIFWNEKKLVFIKLKLWEDSRSMKFLRHKRLLDFISSYIFSKLNRGRETSVAIAKYLKEHAAGDISYSNELKSQLVYLPSKSLPHTNSLKSSLAILGQAQTSLSIQFRELGQGIEK